jgi:membrane protein implicated in regulation of membrane protease activity
MISATIWESISQAGQTTVFISIGLIGFVYLVGSAFFGGLGGGDTEGHDVDSGDAGDLNHGETAVSIFSFKVMAIFFVGFGGIGAIASHNDMSATTSAFLGLGSGAVFGLVGWSMLRAMYRQQSNSAILTDNAIGKIGQVTINIPSEGVGEVGVTVQGSYSAYSARTENGQPLSAGRKVKIKSNAGGQLVVEPA